MLNEWNHRLKIKQVNANCAEKIGVFSKGILRIIEKNKEHANAEQMQ